MKTVFSNVDQAIHIWANQTQGEGKAGNVSFDGPILYSYYTPIARLMLPPGCEDMIVPLDNMWAVLHSTNSYSVTTSRHQRIARQASSQYQQFHVPNIGVGGGWSKSRYSSGDMHSENMQSYADRYIVNQKKAYASTVNIDWYVGKCSSLREEAEQYAAFFQIAAHDPLVFPLLRLDDTKLAKARARSERAAIKNAERQKREDTYRSATITQQVQMYLAGGEDRMLPYNWQNIVGDDMVQAVYTYSAAKWRAGKSSQYHGYDILLRLKDETTIETSMRAQFPVSDAIRAFCFISHCVETHTGFCPGTAGTQPIQMGSFKIDSIDADGTVRAGCHNVFWDEISLMAERLGLLSNVPPIV